MNWEFLSLQGPLSRERQRRLRGPGSGCRGGRPGSFISWRGRRKSLIQGSLRCVRCEGMRSMACFSDQGGSGVACLGTDNTALSLSLRLLRPSRLAVAEMRALLVACA